MYPLTPAAVLFPHLSSHSVVVEPHPGVDVPVGLAGVQEVPGELLAEFHVGAASPPLPGVLWPQRLWGEVLHDAVHHAFAPVDGLQLQTVQLDAEGLLIAAPLLVTAARLQLAHGAGVGHGVHHARRRDGIGKGALSEPWEREQHNTVAAFYLVNKSDILGFQSTVVAHLTV